MGDCLEILLCEALQGLSHRLAGAQSFPFSHSLHPGPWTHLSSLYGIPLELSPAFLIWERIGNFLTKIAHTQQGVVTEQSLFLAAGRDHSSATHASMNTGYAVGKKLIVLPIKSLISQGFLSQGPLNAQSELELFGSFPGV